MSAIALKNKFIIFTIYNFYNTITFNMAARFYHLYYANEK